MSGQHIEKKLCIRTNNLYCKYGKNEHTVNVNYGARDKYHKKREEVPLF
jgi:hypothetical protein